MMTATEKVQNSGPPQIVKFDKAFKLAEQWVNSMTKSAEDEPIQSELEGRPAGVGLGAKVSRHLEFRPSNDPVERRLYAKLDANKRKASKSTEDSVKDGRDMNEDDDEDDLESRTHAFSKKRAAPPVPSLQGKKKQK